MSTDDLNRTAPARRVKDRACPPPAYATVFQPTSGDDTDVYVYDDHYRNGVRVGTEREAALALLHFPGLLVALEPTLPLLPLLREKMNGTEHIGRTISLILETLAKARGRKTP